eukprot:1060117_1
MKSDGDTTDVHEGTHGHWRRCSHSPFFALQSCNYILHNRIIMCLNDCHMFASSTEFVDSHQTDIDRHKIGIISLILSRNSSLIFNNEPKENTAPRLLFHIA